MKIVSVADLKAHLSAYLVAAEQNPVVITRNGKPVAVLVHAGDEEDLERLIMAHSPKLQAILDAARQRFRAGEGIPHETFWQEVEAETSLETTKPSRTRKKVVKDKRK
ncbi:MAG: type II toxin-antitoxin system Phd/YefM family antitoxin [Gemmataceae bacterium]